MIAVQRFLAKRLKSLRALSIRPRSDVWGLATTRHQMFGWMEKGLRAPGWVGVVGVGSGTRQQKVHTSGVGWMGGNGEASPQEPTLLDHWCSAELRAEALESLHHFQGLRGQSAVAQWGRSWRRGSR